MQELPDLKPELIEALLESLGSWDPRASVPLTLTFMEHADPTALDGFSRLMASSSGADSMLSDRFLSKLLESGDFRPSKTT